MRRSLSAALCAVLALSALPAEAQVAAARAIPRVSAAPVPVSLPAPTAPMVPALAAPAILAAPAFSVSPAPVAMAAPRAAVPVAAPAAAMSRPEAAGPREAARPAVPEAAESASARASAMFDGAALAAAAKDDEPVEPPPSARGPRHSDPSYQPRLDGRGKRLLRGARREPQGPRARATAFAARVTGVAGILGAWREGLLIQRHAARLADRSQSDGKRAASARLLAQFGRVEAVPVLGLAHESDPSPAVRRASLASLVHLAQRVEAPLIRRLKLSFFSVTRASAADALGWIVRHADAPASVDALSAAAQADRSEEVRLDAIESLGRARSPRAIAALEWLASVETRPRMRAAALTALAEARARLAAAGRAHYAPPPEDLPEAAGAVHSLALKRAVGIGLFFAAVEFAGSLWTGNLALRADALHLAGDRLLDATALFALWLGRRPPTSRRTYGFLKAEAVFAFLGSLAIAGLGLHMIPEAFAKLAEPSAVPSWSVVGFASMSLVSNLISAAMLFKQKDSHMGMKGAFLHMLTDAAGTFGVIAAAAAHILWGIAWLEPIVIGVIVFLILKVAWELGKPAWNVLLDGVPAGVSLDRLEADLLAVPGVAAVYDLHVRSLTSSAAELSAKLYAKPGADHAVILASSRAFLKERYGIVHSTIQIEPVPDLGL